MFGNAYSPATAPTAPGDDMPVLSAPVAAPNSAAGQPGAHADATPGTQQSGAAAGTQQSGAAAGTQQSGAAAGTNQAGAMAGTQQGSAVATAQPVAVVKGRIDIEDEVVEKVAGMAAVEVAGVSELGGNLARAFEAVREHVGVGQKRGTQGVRAKVEDRQVWIHVVIVIDYGAVVMDVARAVKANVARAVSHMLGLRVVEVDVTVDDVAVPRPSTSGTVLSYSRGPYARDGYAGNAIPGNATPGDA
jgi:uncharacterized alkaline shock family protein YloU